MNLLNKNLENLLEKLLKKYQDEPMNINSSVCERNEIEHLIEGSYFKIHASKDSISGWIYFVYPTQKAITYFEDKKRYKKQKRNSKIIEWTRYGITTIIAVAGLIVAIIALVKGN